VILHITGQEAWRAAQREGAYRPPSLATEGFIHFSRPAQLARTADRHYAGVPALLVLHVDEARLGDALRVEVGDAATGEEFPHLYGPLDVGAVVDVMPLEQALGRAAG
jgi:uncharacterized protein (DUF952 family)